MAEQEHAAQFDGYRRYTSAELERCKEIETYIRSLGIAEPELSAFAYALLEATIQANNRRERLSQ